MTPTRPCLRWIHQWQTDPHYRAAALERMQPEDVMLRQHIVEIVRMHQRNVPAHYGVLPKSVQALLPYDLAEFTIRRHMVALWQAGLLERMGGQGARRGYRLAAPRKLVVMPKISIVIRVEVKVA